MMNKYTIGTIVGTALISFAKSKGSKWDDNEISITSLDELIRYANDPDLAPLVTEIDIIGDQLTSIPPEIGNLQNLHHINLSNNQLTSIPPEIGNIDLQYLDLSNNQLTTLPPEIGTMQHITRLYLSDNQLTSIPKEIGNMQYLRGLYLSDNQLSTIPLEIGNLQYLNSLSLDNNPLNFLSKDLMRFVKSRNKLVLDEILKHCNKPISRLRKR